MQGIGAGIQWRSRPLIRLAVAVAVVFAIFVAAPPAQSLPNNGLVDFALATSNPGEGSGTHTVDVRLDVGVDNTLDIGFSVDVVVAIPSGSATGGGVDYTFATTTVTFDTLDPQDMVKSVDIDLVVDDLDEDDETIELELVNLVNATGGTSAIGLTDSHTVTIADDDIAGVDVSPTTVAATEGGPNGSYNVVLTSEPISNVTVNVLGGSQASGSALAAFTPEDWDSSKIVTVTAINDAVVEGPHQTTISHTVTSTDPKYGTIVPTSVTVDITDNDVAGVTITESSGSTAVTEGTVSDTYTVVLTRQPSSSVIVTVSPDAQVSVDKPSLTFTIGNWNAAQTVIVTAVDDPVLEAPHTGTVTHSASGGGYTGVTIAPVVASIADNDFTVRFALATSSVLEGSTSTSLAPVTVVLDTGGGVLPPAGATVNVVLSVGGTATPDDDFVFLSPVPVTFLGGSADGDRRTVNVAVSGDLLTELDETVILGMADASAGGTIVAPTSHTLTIRNDDVDLGLSVLNAAPVTEGPLLTRLMFTVLLNPGSGGVVRVKYATANGTATAPGDFTAITTPIELTFLPGQTSKDVFVTVANDAVDEITETVLLNLTDPFNSILADAQGVGMILDDDNVAPIVAQLATTDTAGNPGFEFMTGQTVKLSGTFTDPGLADTHIVTVHWGDGGAPVVLPPVAVGSRSFEATHVYLAESFFGIEVTVTDGDPGGTSAVKNAFVSVNGESVAEGDHRIGLVDPATGRWHLYNEAGSLATQFFFGNPGDYPFMGDWDGDGIETPGLYRQSDGFVYLTNTNSTSTADISFFFGNPGDIPIAGDFNGDGFDTVSIFRPSNQTAFIINELGEDGGGLGAADVAYVIGNPGDKPFVGDFDGDGVETVGLHRESTGLVYYRNAHSAGFAHGQFLFGDPDDRLVAGDWTGNGDFSPALFRPAATTMFFRYTNSQGNADFEWSAGESEWLPVSGVTGF